MTLQTATISGQILSPDLTAGLAVTAYIEAATQGTRLTYNGNVIAGAYRVDIAADGTATVNLPINGQSGLLPASFNWLLVWKLGADTDSKQFTISGDTTWGALVDVSNTPLTNSLLTQCQNYANQAAASAASASPIQWQASTTYAVGNVAVSPDGTNIVRKTAGTSGASFDSTEQAAWDVVVTKSGTLAKTALDGAYTTQSASDGRYLKINEGPVSPYRYGFVGDGVTDDATALQNTINACPTGGGGEIVLPHSGNCYIGTPLTIDRALIFRGRSMYSQRIQSHGCDAIHINAGVSNVIIRDLELSASTRYSTTANTFIGVKMDGTTSAHINNILLQNVYCDGYNTAFQARYVWDSTFSGVVSGYGLRGIAVYGLSVNNAVVGWSQLNCAAGSGSVGIGFTGQESSTDTTLVANEGWVISDLFVYNAEIAVDIQGTNFVYISNGIFDYCKVHGVRVQDYGGQYTNNMRIAGCYIAMDGTSAATGILLNNALANPNLKYARITDNELVGYSGQSAPWGIRVQGANAKAVIKGNQIMGFTYSDIRLDGAGDNIVVGNSCFSSTGHPNIYPGSANMIHNNVGSVYYSGVIGTSQYTRTASGTKEVRGPATAAPTTGTWSQGDRVVNGLPTVGQPKGWVCTVGGTPGTWVSEGNL